QARPRTAAPESRAPVAPTSASCCPLPEYGFRQPPATIPAGYYEPLHGKRSRRLELSLSPAGSTRKTGRYRYPRRPTPSARRSPSVPGNPARRFPSGGRAASPTPMGWCSRSSPHKPGAWWQVFLGAILSVTNHRFNPCPWGQPVPNILACSPLSGILLVSASASRHPGGIFMTQKYISVLTLAFAGAVTGF